ncbi:hypothetical protein [Moorena sp. SIO3A2]|uniref:hypothetical protein n=1 Tax=Moorena sp. SIO3A2 TaxID=2607841 RepID=UPI0013BAE20C|nr:hypothetical protein [Moorena sp. SIO3A2]NER91548.1 hypothetical protein [Moorena sp. SIO3A2]
MAGNVFVCSIAWQSSMLLVSLHAERIWYITAFQWSRFSLKSLHPWKRSRLGFGRKFSC